MPPLSSRLCHPAIQLPLLTPLFSMSLSSCTVPRSGVVLRVLFHPKQLMLFSGGDDSEVSFCERSDPFVLGTVALYRYGITAGRA